jgi:hypothetical protein
MTHDERVQSIKKSINKLCYSDDHLENLLEFIKNRVAESKRNKPWLERLRKEASKNDVWESLEGEYRG